MEKIKTYLPHAARILLGLLFFVFGLNGFLGFMPMPPHEGAAGAFLGALAATGYMFPLIKGTELFAGLLLLSNRAVPFALVLLAPILVNIAAFHFVLDPAGSGMIIVLLGIELFLAFSHRDVFKALFTRPAKAGTESSTGHGMAGRASAA